MDESSSSAWNPRRRCSSVPAKYRHACIVSSGVTTRWPRSWRYSTPRASAPSSTRPDRAHRPIVAGSGTARGNRGPWLRSAAGICKLSTTPGVQLFECDQVAVRIAHHEPAGAPVRLLGRDDDMRSFRKLPEPGVDVVDVQMDVRPGAGAACLRGLFR